METRSNYLLKLGSGDKVRNTPFSTLDEAYLPLVCGLFYRVAEIRVIFAGEGDFRDSRSDVQCLFQIAGKPVIF